MNDKVNVVRAVPECLKLESKRLIPLLQSFADRLRNHAEKGVIHPELYEADHAELVATIRHLKQVADLKESASEVSSNLEHAIVQPLKVKVPFWLNGCRYFIEVLDTNVLTACGSDIKTAAGMDPAYHLGLCTGEQTHRLIPDGVAVVLSKDGTTSFASWPNGIMGG